MKYQINLGTRNILQVYTDPELSYCAYCYNVFNLKMQIIQHYLASDFAKYMLLLKVWSFFTQLKIGNGAMKTRRALFSMSGLFHYFLFDKDLLKTAK